MRKNKQVTIITVLVCTILLFGDLRAVLATSTTQTSYIYLPLVMKQVLPSGTNTPTRTPKGKRTNTPTRSPTVTATYTPTLTNIPISVTNVTELISAMRTAGGTCSNSYTINLTLGTYTLTAVESGYDGLPVVNCDVTINGNNSTITRDGAASDFRIFEVASTGRLTLNDIIISGGRTDQVGGAIYNWKGVLNINNSTFLGNAAHWVGGIYNGGGIVNISNSIFSGNTADNLYGGIENDYGTLTISHTTFSNNNGGQHGGSISNMGSGMVTVIDSQFSGNIAWLGGAIYNYGSITISGNTFSGNNAEDNSGGAVWNVGAMTIKDSLFFANLGGAVYSTQGSINNSCIEMNNPDSTGSVISNNSNTSLDAANNWWGSPDGPSGAGSGSGDPVSKNVVFTPFLTSALPGCPPGPFVNSIDVDPKNTIVPVNEQLQISATVKGIGIFSHDVHWSVLSGSGTISSNIGTSIIFFAPSTTDVTAIHAESVADPNKSIDFNLYSGEFYYFSIDPHAPVQVLVNQSVKLFGDGAVKVYKGGDFPVAWTVVGAGTVVPTGGTWNSYTYYAPGVPGMSTLRISLKYFPDYYLDMPVNVISDGPVSCPDPSFPIYPDKPDGSGNYRVGMNALPDWPMVSDIHFENPFDPIPYEIRAVNLRAYVKSPATDPITNVNITFLTDNSSFGPYPMVLITGNGLDGYWRWEGSLPDSICYNYAARAELTNASGTSIMIVEPR